MAVPSDYLVNRCFKIDEPDVLWVMDVTEHPTSTGKLYLATVLDAWSRRVIGWSNRRLHPLRARRRRSPEGDLAPPANQADNCAFRLRIAVHGGLRWSSQRGARRASLMVSSSPGFVEGGC
jgi:transposase InsO family protein